MTRPLSASRAFVALLPGSVSARLYPVFSPLIAIKHLGSPDRLGPQDSAVFSSANGVAAGPDGHGRTAYCVGSATTQAALDRGWAAQQAGKTADDLVTALLAVAPAARLVHLSGVHTRGDIASRLSRGGLTVDHAALYDQVLCPLSDEAAQIIKTQARVIVPLFSPRTAAQFVASAPRLAPIHAVALSASVAHEVPHHAVAGLIVADHPDAQAMGVAIGNLVMRN